MKSRSPCAQTCSVWRRVLPDVKPKVSSRSEALARVGQFTAALFIGLFLWGLLGKAQPSTKWESTFARFQVPAASFPGWDARNIQMAAHCLKAGIDPLAKPECVRSGHLLKRLYPQGTVPGYNYPIWWAKAYAWFDDDSESFFLQFWRLNALALTATIGWLCWRCSRWLLPVLLLNPVTLLTIERGNVDGITFAVALSGWMYFRFGNALRLLGVLLAAVLKVYPLLGLIGMWGGLRGWRSSVVLLALLPALCLTCWELPSYIAQTTHGYPYSYGLFALSFAPSSSGLSSATALVTAFMVLAIMALGMPQIKIWRDDVRVGIRSLSPGEAQRFFVFLTIYVGTFFVFVNWAYRLVFLYPVFVSALCARGWALKVFGSLIGLMLWAPWLERGWEAQTCLAYLVTGLALAVLGDVFRQCVNLSSACQSNRGAEADSVIKSRFV